MSRKLISILVSSALVFGTVSTSAWSAPAGSAAQTQAVQTVAPANNQSPLPPGGAAGIEQAQGFQDSPWFGIGVIVGLFVLGVLLLQDDDDDDTTSTTGT
jgi:import receptor subunit TOM6-like